MYELRLRENLPRVREAIEEATSRVGRREGEVTLVAVTKAHPPAALSAALSVGLTDLGENRLEEMEREAGAVGGADLVWINGETFHNLTAERLLQGPWAGAIPSAAWVDSASAIVMRDFEQELNGFESPWGRVQFALIYDLARTPDPPRTVEELGRWILAHPGRFTHDQSFTGMTFLKVLMYTLGGGVTHFQGGFSEVVVGPGLLGFHVRGRVVLFGSGR